MKADRLCLSYSASWQVYEGYRVCVMATPYHGNAALLATHEVKPPVTDGLHS